MKYLKLAIFLATLPGLVFLSRTSSPAAFHKIDPLMLRGEARHAELLNPPEIHLNVVDLLAWQEENFALKAKMGDSPHSTGDSPRFLSSSDLPASFTFSSGGRDYLILPSKEGLLLTEELQLLFLRLQRETDSLLLASLSVLVATLAMVFRKKAPLLASPVFCAITSTLGILGYFGEGINFFQILSLFIVIGLGIDYAIFHMSSLGSKNRCKVILVSFLTSLTGFGALAFTTFAVTRSMGKVLALGLFFAYIYSLPQNRGQSPKQPAQTGDSPHLENWFEQKEQSAGMFRIALMWWIYRILGKNAAKLLFLPAWAFIYPFCGSARMALAQYYDAVGVKPHPFRHLLSFAWSLLDKTDACTLCKNAPRFVLDGDKGWLDGGAFLISTHLGTIEVLPALREMFPGKETPRVHAFQQLGHDAIFTRLFLKYIDSARLTLHAVEDIGVETAVDMQQAISRGDLVLMAGDRPSAGSRSVLKTKFFGRETRWPKGVFTFARMMESPVYAIVAVKSGWNTYKIVAKRLGGNLLVDYVAFLERETRKWPYQWYQFYRFF